MQPQEVFMSFRKRGLIIHPEEISDYWEELILSSDLNSVGIHPRGGLSDHEGGLEAAKPESESWLCH